MPVQSSSGRCEALAPSGPQRDRGSPACSTHPYDSLSHPLQPTPAPGPASPSPTCTACDKDGVSRCTLTRVLPTSLLIGATKQDLCQCKSLGKSKHFFPQWCLFPTEIFKTPLGGWLSHTAPKGTCKNLPEVPLSGPCGVRFLQGWGWAGDPQHIDVGMGTSSLMCVPLGPSPRTRGSPPTVKAPAPQSKPAPQCLHHGTPTMRSLLAKPQ